MEKMTIGPCPVCGGNVVRTAKGFKCENSLSEAAACTFYVPGVIGNRIMKDDEVSRLLNDKEIIIDGFTSKEGKPFTTILHLRNGQVVMDSTVGVCPRCGREVRVNARAFGCLNYQNQEHPCSFTIWRTIGGHEVTLKEAREICADGQTSGPIRFFYDNGDSYQRRLELTEDKLKVRMV